MSDMVEFRVGTAAQWAGKIVPARSLAGIADGSGAVTQVKFGSTSDATYESLGIWAQFTTDEKTKLNGITSGAEPNPTQVTAGQITTPTVTTPVGWSPVDMGNFISAHAPASTNTSASVFKSGGSDPIKLDELAAPTDITTLNVSLSAHGLCPKCDGNSQHYLNGKASWAGVAEVNNDSQWADTSVVGQGGNFVLAPGRIGYNSTNKLIKIGDSSTAWSALSYSGLIPLDTTGALTDVTTYDLSTTAHGFAPKATNNTQHVLKGDATWGLPSIAKTTSAWSSAGTTVIGAGVVAADTTTGLCALGDGTTTYSALPAIGAPKSKTVITATGSGTISKPANAVWADVIICGAGGGGGSGASGNGNPSSGGGAGGGGCQHRRLILAADLPSSISYTVGTGGAGGTGVSGTSAGNAGSVGGATTFGTADTAYFVFAGGGGGGAAGGNNVGVGGGGSGGAIGNGSSGSGATGGAQGAGGGSAGTTIQGGTSSAFGGGAGAGNASTGVAGNIGGGGYSGGGGGGSGGGISGGTTATAGGDGGYGGPGSGVGTTHPAGGTVGAGQAGTAGTAGFTTGHYAAGHGGAGGASALTGTAGAGGAGGGPGGGGGGGGAAMSTGTASGAGGAGANGRIIVVWY